MYVLTHVMYVIVLVRYVIISVVHVLIYVINVLIYVLCYNIFNKISYNIVTYVMDVSRLGGDVVGSCKLLSATGSSRVLCSLATSFARVRIQRDAKEL